MFKKFDKNQTFRPKKSLPKGSKQHSLHKQAKENIKDGNLLAAVKCPQGEDVNEWMAVNTVDFFNQINLLYGSIQHICTNESCPVMCAGEKYQYFWADGVKVKTPEKLSAPHYMEKLMTWVQDQMDDTSIFPSGMEHDYPKNFRDVMKNIFRRLFRVYAHIYHSHFAQITSQGEGAHFDNCLKHFVAFVNEFELVDEKEMAPLAEKIMSL